MNENLMVVKQLPVIEEHLKDLKNKIEEQVNEAVSLVVTEETLKSVKIVRANLNKLSKEFEAKRLEIKKKVLEPYNEFENIYKECVSDPLKRADDTLKGKISSVEETLKERKYKEVQEYFDEYAMQNHVSDIADFKRSGLNITLSASMKSLKSSAKSYIDNIISDLALIATQEHKNEILFEYKQSLNVSEAVTTVKTRHAAIDEQEKSEDNGNVSIQETTISVPEENAAPLSAPEVEEQEQIISLRFTVWGTKTELKKLKNYIIERGLRYE